MHNFIKKFLRNKLTLAISSVFFCALLLVCGLFLIVPKVEEGLPAQDVEGYSGSTQVICTMSYGYTVMEANVNYSNKTLYYICRQNDGSKTGYMTTTFQFWKTNTKLWETSVKHNASSDIDSTVNLSSYITGDERYTLMAVVSWTTTFSGSGTYTSGDGYTSNVVNNYTYILDTTAPSVSASVGNGGRTNQNVTITARDALTGYTIYYNRAGGSFTAGSQNSSVTVSADGVYNYYAVDGKGNKSSTYSFTIDKTAPTVSASVANGAETNQNVKITASDNLTGYTLYYNRGGGAFTTISSGSTLSAEGVYNYYARDGAGNQSATYSFTIDKTPPVVTRTGGTETVVDGVTYSRTHYYLSGTDNLTGFTIYYNNNGGTWYTDGKNQNSTAFTSNGRRGYYAVDGAGNESEKVYLVLDTVAPTFTATALTYNGDSAISNGATISSSFSIKPADALSGLKSFTYKFPWQTSYTEVPATSTLYIDCTRGNGEYSFKAVDYAGNEATFVVNMQADLWCNNASLREEPALTGKTYSIKNEKQLAWIAWQNRANGTTFSGYTINIEADLDMSAHYWAPITYVENMTFNGNNHVIYGIKTIYGQGATGGGNFSNYTSSDRLDYYGGFFGLVNSGSVIKNVNLSNITAYTKYHGGGLAGCLGTNVEVENCFVSGTINASVGSSAGFVGLAWNCKSIKNSGFTGTVNCKGTAGSLFVYEIRTSNLEVENCFAYGNISMLSEEYLSKATAYGGIIAEMPADRTNLIINNLVGNAKINGTQYKGYISSSTFDPKLWFQEPKLCGGMPLLRQFYWLGSAYGQQTISLSGYAKYTY